MHNIIYRKGLIESELFEIVNVHKPFHSKVDKVKRKASLTKLIISPDETRKSAQIKRFLVPVGTRYAYKMHVSYKDDIKCHSIYNTNSSIDKLLRNSVIKYVIDNVEIFPDLKHDLVNIVRVLTQAWEFDCIITDIPWLSGSYDNLPVFIPNWQLLSYNNVNYKFYKPVNLILKEYSKIPLNILPYECFELLDVNETDIVKDKTYEYISKCKCPLILMRSNCFYSGYIVNKIDCGLPASLFKVMGKA